jgi:SAM-dependent methyltransferase
MSDKSSSKTTTTSSPVPSAAAFWDDKYGDPNIYTYGTEPNDFLKEMVKKFAIPGKEKCSCLMLADGEGRNGVFMAQQKGFDKVVSVDISEAGLAKANSLAKEKGVEIETVLADLGEFDFGDEQWDCIVSIFCHVPPPVRQRVLEQIPKSLKAGGYFVMESYTPKQLEYKTGGPPVPELMYTQQILDQAFQQSLEILKNEELDRHVVEGTLHTGLAAVVQFVGRKPS